jgi:membrane protease YdiL (CAAX protease family)
MTRDEVLANVWAYLGVGGAALLALAVLLVAVPGVRRRPWPLPRLRPVRWGGNEVVVTVLLYVGLQMFLPILLIDIGFFDGLIGMRPAEGDNAALSVYLVRCMAISSPLYTFLTLALMSTLLFVRCGLRPHHYGLSLTRWPAQVAIGLATFLLLTPAVLGLFTLVVLVLGNQPHALASLKLDETEPWEWGFVFFQAVISAALLEEIVFRGILLGWLRRANLAGHTILMGLIGLRSFDGAAALASHHQNTWQQNLDPLFLGGALIVGYGVALYLMLKRHAKALDPETMQYVRENPDVIEPDEIAWKRWSAGIAIYGSSALFAMSHAAAWPTPIPLFFFAAVLGWLATRTQSLIAPITVHMLFNFVAFLVLLMTR